MLHCAMPKFDPYKPPMSLDESERLLRAADQEDFAKADRAQTLMILGLLAIFAGVAVGLWLLSLVIGPTPAGLIGFFAVMIWLWRQE